MWLSDEFILVENPRCGVERLAGYLNLARSSLPPHATTQEARKAAGIIGWRERTKIISVRDPVERFVSAARARARDARSLEGLDIDDIPPDNSLCESALALPAESEDHRDFWPQIKWLTGKFDLILPLTSFAAFANSRQTGRRISPGNQYRYRSVSLSDEIRQAIRERYAEDYEKFAKLPVWPSSPGNVVLLAGACKTCNGQRKPS